MGEILRVQPDTVNQALDAAVEALRAGELIIMPTDTVYGLAGELSTQAALRIFEAKGRQYDKPLPVLVSGLDQLQQVSRYIPPAAEVLGRRFWPGPLTLIVRRADRVPPEVTSGGETVGVRVPDHELVLALLQRHGSPIVATSANPSGAAPAVNVSELPATLLEAVALVLDAGPCPLQQASTVLDLTAEPPRVLRSGPISAAELAQALRSNVLSAYNGNAEADAPGPR